MRDRTVAEWLRWGRGTLANSTTPDLDAELLLGMCCGMERSRLLGAPEKVVPVHALTAFQQAVRRRVAGYPIAYLRGIQEFYGRTFEVTPDVLVPRPETELLVDAAMACLSDGDDLIDCGTGSGCVAVSVAGARPGVNVHAVDVSASALSVARRNAARLGADVRFFEADLLPPQDFHPPTTVIAANLPYVSDDDYAALPDLRHEPALALRGGRDGLVQVRRLLGALQDWPTMPKATILEIDPDQAEAVRSLGTNVELKADLSGRTRLAILTTAVRPA